MKSRTTDAFRKCLKKLPLTVQAQAREAYRLFEANPYHASLHFKCIDNGEAIYSARVGRRYRVLGILEEDTISWFWIGSHEDYNNLV